MRRVLLLSPLLVLSGCLHGRPAAYPPPPREALPAPLSRPHHPRHPHRPHHVVPQSGHWYWNGTEWVLVHGCDVPH